MVITLPVNHIQTHPGMDIVVFSRAASKESLPIKYDNVNGVTVGDLKVIVQSKTYFEHRNFVNLLW